MAEYPEHGVRNLSTFTVKAALTGSVRQGILDAMSPARVTAKSLTPLSTSQLQQLLLEVAVELSDRADGEATDLPSVMGALGRSLGLVGAALGWSYARAWTHEQPWTDAQAWTDEQAWTEVPMQHAPSPVGRAWQAPWLHHLETEVVHPFTMYGLREDVPGPQWAALFDATWPAYRAWYTSEGLHRRPDLDTCRAALKEHMPELVSTWQRLVDLAGGDPLAARMLSLWDAPAYATACSQLVIDGPRRVLVRNYDYDPGLFEQVVYSTRFTRRRVIGTSDCLWGLLDGMNDDGLLVSLTYGGRPGSGTGFAIPLVVRYLLEVCATLDDALEVLRRLPVAASYNLTVSDAHGGTATVFVAPDSAPEVFDTPLATNHRGLVPEYPELAGRLNSVERQGTLQQLLDTGATDERVTSAFLEAPLHNTEFSTGFATLYTAVYQPDRGLVEYLWPDASWRRGFDSDQGTKDVVLREPAAA